jgi:hypothetical protein
MTHLRKRAASIARTLLCTVLAVQIGIAANADQVLSFNEGTGSGGANQNQSVGWQFDVLAPITVTGLGWFDENADGLGAGHTVGIWDSAGNLLTSTAVPSGVGAAVDGQFRTVGITALVLPIGTGYIVGGENFSNSGDRLAFNVSQTVDSRINFVDATFSNIGSGFARPTNFSSATTGFYGPSFAVKPSAVPEPSSLLLFVSGAAGLGFIQRKRRAKA